MILNVLHLTSPRAKRAFTLIETLVAITILTLAIVGPLYAANRAIVAARTSRDQLTATYLAQEAIEYVRLMRDDDFLARHQAGGSDVSATAWNDFISGSGAGSIASCRTQTCTLDPWSPMGTGSGRALESCTNACQPLVLFGGEYHQSQNASGSTPTPFTRTIRALDLPGFPNDERIVATVSWSYHGTPYTVSVTDHLTPWQ